MDQKLDLNDLQDAHSSHLYPNVLQMEEIEKKLDQLFQKLLKIYIKNPYYKNLGLQIINYELNTSTNSVSFGSKPPISSNYHKTKKLEFYTKQIKKLKNFLIKKNN